MTLMPEPLVPVRRIEIPRKDGQSSLWVVVDETDYELVSPYRWRPSERGFTFYAIARRGGGTIYMHRLLLQVPPGMEVDHIDRDGLNNRRSNLRLATRAENVRNQRGFRMRAGRPTTSRFKGVSRRSAARGWEVRIQVGDRREYVGAHLNEEEAARMYDRRAREVYGEFACLNFADEVTP